MALIPVPLTADQRANTQHFYWDIIWWGVLAGSTINFLAIFAARLGASSLEIGLLSAGPAVINLMFSISAGSYLSSRPLLRTSIWLTILFRLGYLVMMIPPLLAPPSIQVVATIFISLLMTIPGVYQAIMFNSLFAAAIPAEWRSTLVGRRNALVAVSIVITSLVCGQILEYFPFPLNYSFVFGIGFIGAVMSTVHLWQIKLNNGEQPMSLPQLQQEALASLSTIARGLRNWTAVLRTSLGAAIRQLNPIAGLRWDLVHSGFGAFLFAYLLFYTFQFFPVALFPVAYVQELGLKDDQISFGTAFFHTAVFFSSLGLGQVTRRFGNRFPLVFGAISYGAFPLLIGLGDGLGSYLLACLAGGLMWGFAGGGLINRLMERAASQDVPAHMALHNLVLNIGILTGSFFGPLIGDLIGVREVLILAAILRVLGGLALWRWA